MDADGGQAAWAAVEARGLAIDLLPQPPWRSTVAFTEVVVIGRSHMTSHDVTCPVARRSPSPRWSSYDVVA